MKKSIHTTEYNVFLDLLRHLREDAELTQDEIATTLQATQTFISKCERGERRLDFVEWFAWCSALGISPQTFVTRYETALHKAR